MSQKHGTAATEDFDKPFVFLGEYGIEDRQQCGFVADAGNWGSDRLLHTPF
jgi:hypothetical protein